MLKNLEVLVLAITLVISVPLFAQQSSKGTTESSVSNMSLGWPFDRYSGFENYAQELIFNRDKGYEYLEQARKYYLEGYNLIKRYQINPEKYDPYERDPYKIESGSPTDLSMRQDFALAQVYFTRALDITARYIDWDNKINQEPLYKSLVENCYKNVIYTAVYNGNFNIAMNFLQEYKKHSPDENFVDEWNARIMGNLVKLHEKYSWAFVGKLSADNMKREHRKMLNDAIEKKYASDENIKTELEKRIYPDEVMAAETTTDEKSTETKETTTPEQNPKK